MKTYFLKRQPNIFIHAGADEAITSKKILTKIILFLTKFRHYNPLGILKFLLTRLIEFSKFGDEFLLRINEIIVKIYSSNLLIGAFSYSAKFHSKHSPNWLILIPRILLIFLMN
jgi:hypothetical protein